MKIEYTALDKQRFMQLHEEINNIKDLNKTNTNLQLGRLLYYINKDGLYVIYHEREMFERKCKNIYQYAEVAFGYKKSSVNNFINCYQKYCNEDGTLKQQYYNFNFSQLVETLPYEESFLKAINSSMSCKSIRKTLQKLSDTIPLQPEIVSKKTLKELDWLDLEEEKIKDFLKEYKTWQLIEDIKILDMKIYKTDFERFSLIAFETIGLTRNEKELSYYIKNHNEPFRICPTEEDMIIKILKNTKQFSLEEKQEEEKYINFVEKEIEDI